MISLYKENIQKEEYYNDDYLAFIPQKLSPWKKLGKGNIPWLENKVESFIKCKCQKNVILLKFLFSNILLISNCAKLSKNSLDIL